MKYLIALLLLSGITGVLVSMRLNKKGLDLIKESEDISLTPYLDIGGRPTIGWGHLIKEGESFTAITEHEANLLLIDDVAHAESIVNQAVKVEITQNMFNALTSFVYNVGAGAFMESTLLRKLNAGDYDGAANEFTKWRYFTNAQGDKVVSNGLFNRRAKEQRIFVT